MNSRIAAVVLAAGLSRRMGTPKMVLPWGETTVIGRVVSVLTQAGIEEVLVITGGARQQVEVALQGMPARVAFNPRFAEDHMTLSLQVGLAALPADVEAALVTLGDQPQIEPAVVQAILQAYFEKRSSLVVPSYQHHRGHPWLIARELWKDVFALHTPQTLREFLNAHAGQIDYLPVENASVIRDLDTREDYERDRPAPSAG